MKQLKTAQEVLDDHTNYGSCDGHLPISEQIKNAMRAYAEQFIEQAAEEILVDDSDDTNKNIILKLKEHLK